MISNHSLSQDKLRENLFTEHIFFRSEAVTITITITITGSGSDCVSISLTSTCEDFASTIINNSIAVAIAGSGSGSGSALASDGFDTDEIFERLLLVIIQQYQIRFHFFLKGGS
jgi:hypothetical protein